MKYGRGAGSLILGIRSPLQFDDSIALLANQNYLILVGEKCDTVVELRGAPAPQIGPPPDSCQCG